ncbi:hypothetical protein Tco_0565575, partial [Tanacetum coccineum]
NDDDDDNDDDNDDDDNQYDDGQEYDEHNDEEQGGEDDQTDSDNDGNDFVHPKFSTHDEEDKEEDSFDPRVQTPSHVESTNDEDSGEEIQDANVEGDKMNEEETNEEAEVDALYRDVNVNLEGRDTEMTDAPCTIVQTTQVIEDTHVIITPVYPEGQQQSSSVSSGFVSNMLNPSPDTCIDSLFNLNTKSTLLVDVSVTTFAEPPLLSATTLPPPPTPLITHLQQTPVPTPSTVPSSSLQDLPNFGSLFGSDEQKNLYKALVDAYESDKLILDTYGDTISFKRRRDDEDKDEEPYVGSNRGSKRRRARKEPESTSSPKENTSKTIGKSTEGSKSHHKEPIHTAKDLDEPAHQEFETGVTEDQPNEETSQHPDWFQKPAKPPTPNRVWNKTLPEAYGPVQPWLSSLAQMEDPRESFNELTDTPLDFSAFVMNRLKVDTLTPELLAVQTFELMKGSSKSLVELEYFLEEVYKATTNQLDWINPEGQQYPHDLRKPLPLIPNSRRHQVIPFYHFINNDLEYLSGDVSSRKYTTSVTKTKIADYGHIK